MDIKHIDSDVDFAKALKIINDVFNINKRLPNMVFNEKYSNFMFQEFDWAMSSDFWDKFAKPICTEMGDENLLISVLDPDPIDYFNFEFGYYNAVKLPISISGLDYFKYLEQGPQSSPADAMLFNSNIVVWLPNSSKWAIWGSRDFGVAVLALGSDFLPKDILEYWEKSSLIAYNKFILPNISNEKLKKDFLRNYTG